MSSDDWQPDHVPADRWQRCISSLSQWTEAQLPPHTWPPSRYICNSHRDTRLRSTPPQYAHFNDTARDDNSRMSRLALSLRGGRIWFVGDSIACEHFYSAACLIGAELSWTSANHALRPIKDIFEANLTHTSSRGSLTHRVKLHHVCVTTADAAQLCIATFRDPFRRKGSHSAQERFPESPAEVLQVLSENGAGRKDVILANVGIHYQRHVSAGPSVRLDRRHLAVHWRSRPDDELLTSDVLKLIEVQRQLKASRGRDVPLLIWRETSPVHFPTAAGKPCTSTEAWKRDQARA